ncbi:hypothetical protein FNH22_17405 [Fulvivirga sp. M361]|uniref:DoxX family protein n=1 Tax=Fulvivirga sp. M361 TaxID=2594266 RepID=UPI00117A529B|nr:DoxX family protein [Fulvivirga sp. M361]TRX55943.1 hypothetical protein FNH22_17405 [Fulvivirga sp. M361]
MIYTKTFSLIVPVFGKNFILWVIVLLLFGILIPDGLDQLRGGEHIIFGRWGYSCLFIFLIGLTKVLSASGLLVPRFRQIAVFLIIGVALFGSYIHFTHQEVVGLLINIMNIGLAAMVYWCSSKRFHIPQ